MPPSFMWILDGERTAPAGRIGEGKFEVSLMTRCKCSTLVMDSITEGNVSIFFIQLIRTTAQSLSPSVDAEEQSRLETLPSLSIEVKPLMDYVTGLGWG